jgi:Tol biopolymer transport system component
VFYVMPYVEGESLRDRLNREHQLPVADAVRIAREAADALAYAHDHGVVHRDIKPENILLQGGHALVADFGIALAASRSEGGSRMTETGMSLGTPQYMSPEQAMGERDITAKADIYALGCVLYECLSGEPPFTGPTPQAIVARVMTEQPRALTLQRRTIPPNVEAAVETALQKLPADRFASAAEFAEALARPDYTTTTRRAVASGSGTRTVRAKVLLLAAMGLAGIAVGLAAARLARARGPDAPTVAFYVEGDSTRRISGNFALSPDGRVLVYGAETPTGRMLFQQPLSQLEPRPIPGTADADPDLLGIVFSPDGKSIAYHAGGALKRIRLDGTDARTITTKPTNAGASWGADGTIIFANWPDSVLWRVSADGGTPAPIPVHVPGGHALAFSPALLPGGKAVLCVNPGRPMQIGVVTLATGEFKPVLAGDSPSFVAPGMLLYGSGGSLVAQAFDADRGDTTGPRRVIIDNVSSGLGGTLTIYQVSTTGALAYQPARLGSAMLKLLRRDGAGRILSTSSRYWSPRVSPDGRRIVFGAYQSGGALADLWVYDLAAGTDQRLTSGGQTGRDYNDGTWSRDGRWLALSGRDTTDDDNDSYVTTGSPVKKTLYVMRSDGTTPPELLFTAPGDKFPTDWTPDGKAIIYSVAHAGKADEIWMMPMSGDHTPVPLVRSDYGARGGRLSPDGRWLAFEAEETGQPEIYVQGFPVAGTRVRVSEAGGQFPMWSRDGHELYYWNRGQMLAAQLRPGTDMMVAGRSVLFDLPIPNGSLFAQYDVLPDGRFVVSTVPAASSRIAVTTNFQALLPVGAH